MTDYIQMLTNPRFPLQREEAERRVADLREATITDGVIRWSTNDAIPPSDLLALAVHIGLPIDLPKCETIATAEREAILAEYINRAPDHWDGEREFEIRANFEHPERVIDVITGKPVLRPKKKNR